MNETFASSLFPHLQPQIAREIITTFLGTCPSHLHDELLSLIVQRNLNAFQDLKHRAWLLPEIMQIVTQDATVASPALISWLYRECETLSTQRSQNHGFNKKDARNAGKKVANRRAKHSSHKAAQVGHQLRQEAEQKRARHTANKSK